MLSKMLKKLLTKNRYDKSKLSFASVFTSFSKLHPCNFSEASGYFCVVQKWTPTEPVKNEIKLNFDFPIKNRYDFCFFKQKYSIMLK